MKQMALPIGIWVAVFCFSSLYSYHYFSQGPSVIKPPVVRQLHLPLPPSPAIADKEVARDFASSNPSDTGATLSQAAYSWTLQEYIEKTIARTPHRDRPRRTVELARFLYSINDKAMAKDLLESLVRESASDGDPLYPAALNFLRDIYDEEASVDGYKLLLAAIPDSYPGRAAVGHHAAMAYLAKGNADRAYSLLLSQLGKTKDDPMLICDLAKVYESSDESLTAIKEEKAADSQGNAHIYYSLGNHYLIEGREELARRAFDDALRLDPSYADKIALDKEYPEGRRCGNG